MDLERDVRAYLKARLKVMGGQIRKVSWKPRTDAPDELVMVPQRAGVPAFAFFAELKRPKAGQDWRRRRQEREAAVLRSFGLRVEFIESKADVDRILFWR